MLTHSRRWGVATALLLTASGPRLLAGPSRPGPRPAPPPVRLKTAIPTPSGMDLLGKSHWARRHVPFEGREMSVTWTDRRSISAVSKRCRFGSRERSEYLVPAGLRGQIYLRDDAWTRIYSPRARRVDVTPSVETAEFDLPLVMRNYRIRVDPQLQKVAGRSCRSLRLQPIDTGKPYRVLCLDSATFLVLKLERFHPDGSPAALTQFTEIRIGRPPDPSTFTLKLPPGVKEVRRVTRGNVAIHPGVAKKLPAGYLLKSCTGASVNDGWHCVYSDGVDMVSVFAARGSSAKIAPGEPLRIGRYAGTVNRRRRQWILSWISRGERVTIVGDLSRDRIIDLARAVAGST